MDLPSKLMNWRELRAPSSEWDRGLELESASSVHLYSFICCVAPHITRCFSSAQGLVTASLMGIAGLRLTENHSASLMILVSSSNWSTDLKADAKAH